MRLDDYRQSSNIESQRGMGGGLGGGGSPLFALLPLLLRRGGIGGVAILAIALFFFGGSMFGGGGTAPRQPVGQQVGQATNAQDQFVSQVLATTEDTWGRIFQAQGQQYPAPTLVLYDGTGRSGCGVAQAATGPFYCPSDRKIYLDTSFFNELSGRFGAPGDFAQAYVIAHEVGHHIQTVTGVSDQVRQAQARASEREGNAIQVRMELQADCYAGVWGRANQQYLEGGDLQEALRAAQAIGDDTLQRQAQGRVVPDSFTHGSAEQRQRWFRIGYDSGDPAVCDTFSARAL
jgi:predicted metalloprotease